MHRQHLYRPRDKLIRPAILFRGKGRISAVERAAYNPGVDVFFQAGAWVVTATCIAWAKQSFRCSIKVDEEAVPSERSILFVDDLHAQTTDEFKRALVEDCNRLVWLLSPGCTDEVQPADAGCGRLLKVEFRRELELFLD